MELGTVLSAAQSLSSALSQLKEVLSLFGYESELVDLQRTVEALTAVLRDADTKQELSQQAQVFIKQIRDAVFDADDLIDELVTLAQQQRIVDADGSLRERVINFFSKSNPICVSYWMSRGIKDVKKKLDAIAYNNQYSFKIDPEPIRKRSRETCSYCNEAEIIGRERDLEYIVGTLLASDDDNKEGNVSVLSVVGIGGLGKTALAQLVYNDPMVTNVFQLKMWTCVSDQDQKQLDLKDILCKILNSITHQKPVKDLTMDEVQSQIQQELAGKKYLLVLDDVWTEERHQWCELVKYLIGNERGSWILVTTRSQNTAAITGGQIHELSGLTEENSWHLFERTTFDLKQSNPPDEDLVRIGKKIVDGCAGVPLAIKVAGSLLYGQDKSKWLSVQKIGLANTREGGNNIMSILKLSYYHLESPLRSCFSYCALFPKDFEMGKDMLIRLWMAQGYIVPLDVGQSIDDAGEEYFSILLKRCFFQDIQKNEDGEIKSCKIHDLMHDIAQNVCGKEINASNFISGNVDKNVRHLSIFNLSQFERYFSLGNSHIRSLRSFDYEGHLPVDALAKSFKCLRVLDLVGKEIECLPDSIGELLHLRYIDLSWNQRMEALPDSVTKLCNLQTLILSYCTKLKELPRDLSRLVKLRVLDIEECGKLRWMPMGMSKLTCLHMLKGWYIVGGERRCNSWKQWFDGLEDLKSFINLKGQLQIQTRWPEKNAKNDESLREGLYLRSLEHLDSIELEFKGEKDSGPMEGTRMRVMEDLQPHSNLNRLKVCGYDGVKMPGWLTLLSNLVNLRLEYCKDLKYLPCLENFCHLKSLILLELPKLEYIEEDSADLASTSAEKVSFYPSLVELELCYLPKLKGWRRGVHLEESSNNSIIIIPQVMQLSFSQLKTFTIYQCEEFACTLLCPMLETLNLCEFNEGMQIECTKTIEKSIEAAIENPGSTHHVPKLRNLIVSNGAWLHSMSMESFQSLQTLQVVFIEEIEELPSWLQYLSALQTLTIYNCSENLKKRCQKDPHGEAHIQHVCNISID